MFQDATSFNGSIGGWDVSDATNMTNMFNGATAFAQNLDGWYPELIATAPTGFDTGSGITGDPNWGQAPTDSGGG